MTFDYSLDFDNINFRKHPELSGGNLQNTHLRSDNQDPNPALNEVDGVVLTDWYLPDDFHNLLFNATDTHNAIVARGSTIIACRWRNLYRPCTRSQIRGNKINRDSLLYLNGLRIDPDDREPVLINHPR